MSQNTSEPGLFNVKSRMKIRKQVRCISQSKLFDKDWYLEEYPDVAQARCDAARHYVLFGASEGRNPGPDFDTTNYLLNNPDVEESGINPLYHYVMWGKSEGRIFTSATPEKTTNGSVDASQKGIDPVPGEGVSKENKRIKELEQENEMLLLQLHQVQEELETYFLKHQELQQNENSELEKIKQERDSLKDQMSDLQKQRDDQLLENDRLLEQLHNAQEELENVFGKYQEALAHDNRDKVEQLSTEVEGLTSQLKNVQVLLDNATQERDDHAHWHLEYKESAQQLKQKVTEADAKINFLKEQLQEKQQQAENWKNKAESFEPMIQEKEKRQQLIDNELVKAEAQIELIKDVLLRDKAF